MTSITYIDLNLSAVNCAVVVYAKQNDKLARHIAATLYDGSAAWTPPAGSHPIIRFLKPDGTAGFYDVDENEDPAISISGNVATMTIVEQALTVPGDVYMELNFYNSAGEKLTTLKWLLRVQQSVLEDATIISTDYYNVLTAQIAGLLGATTHPPIIDSTTKNWLLWDEDTAAYVDSGYSSIGSTYYYTPSVSAAGDISWTNNGNLQNPTSRNIMGPQGVSISSVSKASGTGAPGTTDVYNVNLSNSTVAGTFNVYNGNDGEGAPGTQTPLVDSGSGEVGTANAYSREDHQHPKNAASSGTPAMNGTGAIGSSPYYALFDHVHPSDTKRAAIASVVYADIDSINMSGIYTISDTSYGCLLHMQWDANYAVQIGHFLATPAKLKFRAKSGVPGTWSAWIDLN